MWARNVSLLAHIHFPIAPVYVECAMMTLKQVTQLITLSRLRIKEGFYEAAGLKQSASWRSKIHDGVSLSP